MNNINNRLTPNQYSNSNQPKSNQPNFNQSNSNQTNQNPSNQNLSNQNQPNQNNPYHNSYPYPSTPFFDYLKQFQHKLTDITTEKYLIASILFNPENTLPNIIPLIQPDDLTLPEHKDILTATLNLYNKKIPIDIVTIYKEIESINPSIPFHYIIELASLMPTSSLAKHYAQILKEKSTLRNIINLCQFTAARCLNEDIDSQYLIQSLQQSLSNLISNQPTDTSSHASILIPSTLNYIKSLLNPNSNPFELYTPSGFPELDKYIGGFYRGDLIILAARPGMGKTTLALNFLLNASKITNSPTIFLSLEMSKQQLSSRLLCQEAKVNSYLLRTSKLPPDDQLKLESAAKSLKNLNFHIIDTSNFSLNFITSKIKQLSQNSPPALIIIDYIQLIKHNEKKYKRDQELAEISSALKELARELNSPIIALSQLNRKIEDRSNKIPQLSDLRDSGALEQDADLILFLYPNPSQQNLHSLHNKKQICLHIAKHRNGPADITIYLNFEPSCPSFIP